MDSNTNDPDPEIPPDVSPEQLEEALKWLEELAGRPDMAPEADTAAMRADSSPFQGLIDSEGGDVPDWLHDAPPLPADQSLADDSEYESRLDWLAKMTERESMEELPTLEWRRISDAAARQATAEGAPPEEPILSLLPEGFDAPTPEEATASALLPEEPDTQPLPEGYLDERFPVAETPEEPLVSEAVLHVPEALMDAPAAVPDTSELEAVELPPLVEEVEATPDLSAAAINPETLLDTLPPDVELPPIDDLDAAMAWIEELAASQDAPIEDVPSVADRALASKLLREAGLSSESLELRGTGNEMSLGDLSLLEGNTPVNAFVAAEDFADTIVLVETMAADQGRALEEPAPPLPIEPQLPEPEPAAVIPPAATTVGDDTFEDAMAFLDELAAAQEPLGSITQPIEPLKWTAGEAVETGDEMVAALVEETADDEWAQPEWLTEPAAVDVEAPPQDEAQPAERIEPEEWAVSTAVLETAVVETATAETAGPAVETQSEALSPEDAPWLEPVVDEEQLFPAEAEPAVELPTGVVAPAVMESMNGNGEVSLEETLLALDALALPPGTSLADVDASLRRGGAPARRDLPAAVEWLEVSLGLSTPLPAAPLSDEDLIARMPEDPDAVLAWLEQMAEEDTVGSSPSLAAGEAAPAAAAPSAAATTEPLIEELSEADLLAMPDDPDAIIAWLEGLAGGSPAARLEPATPPVAVPAEEPSAPEMTAEPLPVEAALVLESTTEAAWPLDVGTTDVGTEDVGTEDVGTATDRAETPPADEMPLAVTVSEVTPVEVIIIATPPAEAEAEAIADESITAESAMAESTAGRPPVAARPRRRGHRTKPTAAATVGEPTLAESNLVVTEAAVASIGDSTAEAVEAAADIVAQEQVTVADSAAEAAAEAEEPPAPPARPASWVDLLKPLR